MSSKQTPPPRGVLKYPVGDQLTHLVRCPPPPALAPFVELFWMVHWDLQGQLPYLQENIPAPCAHLTIDAMGGHVVGPVRGRFSYWLRDQGRVYGIKFHPGGMQPFFGRDMALLTNQRVTIDEVFGRSANSLIADIKNTPNANHEKMFERGAAFLCEDLPAVDPRVAQLREMVAKITQDTSLSSVEELAAASHMSQRNLQRLFRTYIGLSPKWLIRCHRLQEALAQIEGTDDPDWVAMALSLGYFDQAHFIGDFKSVTGRSPTQYQQELRQALNTSK